MPDTTHAEARSNVATVRITRPDKTDFINNLIEESHKADLDRNFWKEKVTRNYKKRFGIRPSVKNFPWPDAANHHIYLSDEKVRRMKPNYINLAFEGDPIARFEPIGATPPEVAQNAELYMDWKLKYHMAQAPGFNYLESLCLIVDDMTGHYGFGVGKVIWHHESNHRTSVIDLSKVPFQILAILSNPLTTDEELRQILVSQLNFDLSDTFDQNQVEKLIQQFRDGETILKYKERYTAYRGSRLLHTEPRCVTVPRDTTHFQTASWIRHDMFMTLQELKVAQRDGKYTNVDHLEKLKPKAYQEFYSTLEVTKESREGNYTFTGEHDLLKISEFYAYYDIDGDGVGEKVVITLSEDSDTSEPVILRFIEFPYDHGKWPFIKFQNELTDERYHSSRGYVEMLDHYQTIATNMENHKLDRMTIANSLPLKARINSINSNNIRWIPGQPIWVKRMDDLEGLPLPSADLSYDQEQEKILRRAESYIGQPDLMLGALDNPAERRTAFEVSEAVSHGRQIFSLDARLFKSALQDLYDQIYELEMQYGDEEVYLRVTGGEENTTEQGQQIPGYMRLTKEQLRGNFVIVPNGEFTLLSRTLEQNRALQLLELGMKDQSGAINHRELWKNTFLKLDPQMAKKALNTLAEYQQIQQMHLQMEQQEFQKKMAIAGRT